MAVESVIITNILYYKYLYFQFFSMYTFIIHTIYYYKQSMLFLAHYLTVKKLN